MKVIEGEELTVDFGLYNYIGENKDINLLKQMNKNEAFYLFGGALRDIFSNYSNINDLDIVCSKKTCDIMFNELKRIGWEQNAYEAEERERYKDILESGIIKLPINLYKKNKIIQLIVPEYEFRSLKADIENQLLGFIQEVDMSCSGLAYEFGTGKVIQTITGAFESCLLKRIVPLRTNEMFHTDKFESRVKKLIKKGWVLS